MIKINTLVILGVLGIVELIVTSSLESTAGLFVLYGIYRLGRAIFRDITA